MKSTWMAVCAVAALAGLNGAPASAQTAGEQPAPPTASGVTVTAEALYDTNVARSSEAEAKLRGLQASDVLYSPGVMLDLTKSVGNGSVFLSGTAGYDFYEHDTILNHERLDLLAGASAPVGRCTTSLTNSLARFQSDLQDLTQSLPQAVSNLETLEQVSFAGSCARPTGLSPNFTVSEVWSTNSANLRETSNYQSFNAQAGLTYSRPRLGALSLLANYANTIFPERLLPGGGHDSYDLYAGGLHYERQVGSRATVKAEAFYSALEPTVRNPALARIPNFSGLTYEVDGAYQLGYRTQFALTYSRAIKPSNDLNATYSLSNSLVASAQYKLGFRSDVELGVSDVDQRDQGSAALLQPATLVNHQIIRAVYGTFDYRLGRRITLVLDLRSEQRTTNLPAFNYRSDRIGLTAKGVF